VRVRTYGFPGCFTRPPGTSTRHHPHEPTTSKPVVPGDVLRLQCIAKRPTNLKRLGHGQAARHCGSMQTKRDAVPSHFEEPGGSGPRAFPCGWRGLTPQWPRSLRLGSASGFKVARAAAVCNPAGRLIPHLPEKSRAPARAPARTSARTRAEHQSQLDLDAREQRLKPLGGA
jgi:hypothetical protein